MKQEIREILEKEKEKEYVELLDELGWFKQIEKDYGQLYRENKSRLSSEFLYPLIKWLWLKDEYRGILEKILIESKHDVKKYPYPTRSALAKALSVFGVPFNHAFNRINILIEKDYLQEIIVGKAILVRPNKFEPGEVEKFNEICEMFKDCL